MNELKAVEPIDSIPDPGLIETLDALLEKVELGEVTSIAIATTNTQERAGSIWYLGCRDDLVKLLGEVVLLQDRLVQHFRDQGDEP